MHLVLSINFISISESSLNNGPNTALIIALSAGAVVVAIILCIAFAIRYPNSLLGRGLTKCQTEFCKKQQPDFGSSSVKASRLNDEAVA